MNVHNSFGKHSSSPFDLIDINGININSNKIEISVVVVVVGIVMMQFKSLKGSRGIVFYFYFCEEKKKDFPGVIHSLQRILPSVSIAQKGFTNKIFVTQQNNRKCPSKNCRAVV